MIERFVKEMQVGDIVVLRLGKHAVYGAGVVKTE
jgi:predicted Mrr-cat superfamily restriction endonuclease